MKFKSFYNNNRIRESLSNIAHGNGYNKYATPTDVHDAIEDAISAEDLLDRLSELNLIAWDNLTIDRITDAYVRIKGVDMLGNIRYLEAEF